ncbi:MAG: DUF4214 domain-containing protein [Vreelandella alkaliphila]
MALTTTQIQQLYTAYFNRTADQEGIDYWQEQGVSESELRTYLANDDQPEYVELYGDRTREELVTAIYQNMFGREPEAEGLEYWVNGDGASVPASELPQLFISAASDEDAAAFDEKVDDQMPTPPGSDETIRLTQQADDLQGADGSDTTFEAPVTQNETGSGALANTFETGDVLDGGADSTNVLRADLIASGAISNNWAPAISAETTNIQEVYLRGQTTRVDLGASNTTFGATVDAEKMAGVEQWWTDNSRANIRIEDIRTATDETTFGMRETDPEVGYEAYFNPLFLEGDVSSDSELSLVIQEIDGDQVLAANELQNITVREVNFTVGGEDVTLANDQISAANTWAELEAAIAAEIEAQDLEGLSVSHTGNGQFVIDDEQGRPFEIVEGEALIFGATADIDVRNRVEVGRLEQEGPTQTTLVLDGAGNGSRGGDVNIAAMSGDRGIEVMDVLVDRDSHIKSLRSENNPNSVQDSFSAEQQLEEVNLTHVAEGAQGTFQVGARTVDEKGVSTTIDDRLSVDVDEDGQGDSGLRDVRVFNATGYSSEIKLAAELSIDVFDKYLAGAEDTVQFSYLLGDAGNNLSLTVNNEVASDPDFALEIIGGDSSDRVNLTDLAVKNSTTIDLEGGDQNTVEVSTTTGATADEDGNFTTAAGQVEYSTAQTAFGEFVNVDRLVIADDNDTRQNIVSGNMTAIDGKEIVIATDAQLDANGDLVPGSAADTDIVQARIDTDLTISGKNQTLGSLNNNNDQFIGLVDVINTRPVPSQSNLEVLLDNTARLDGELTVAALDVSGGTSAVRELDLTSGGRRNTENLVQSAALAGVNTVDLDGTQNLDLHIASMASGASVVDGSDLGGDLDLAINGGLLTGATDVLTGTAAETDTLAVYGGGAQATVTGFETVQLGLSATNQFNGAVTYFSGEFNAAAVSGVEQYNIAALDAATDLINLSGSEVVNVAASNADQDLTLIANDRDGSNEITVNFAGDYSSVLSVQDYRTVTLGLDEGDYAFTLDLETENGTNAGTTYARTLNIVGGTDDAEDTSLDIGDLDTALTTVDLSGYTGSLVGGTWGDDEGSNAEVLVNGFNFSFDVEGDTGATDFITEFRFTTDADSFGTVWNIDNFQVFGAGATLQDRTLINLRDLGLTETDVSWTDGADFWTNLDADEQAEFVAAGNDLSGLGVNDTVVTSNNDGDDFAIVLTGVTQGDLNDENFLYAS